MFRFNYNYTDYELLLHDLGRQLGVHVEGNRLELQLPVATGHLYFLKLPNGIHTLVVSAHLHTDVLLYRSRSDEEMYTLRFDELNVSGKLVMTIGDARIEEENTTRSSAYLTSSQFDWSLFGSAGTEFQSVNVLVSKSWLARYLGLETVEECLPTYLEMKTNNFTIEPLDNEYKRLLREISEGDPTHPLRLAIVQNRILLLIERFFSRLLARMKEKSGAITLSRKDVDRLMQIERALTHDLFRKPPRIADLAREFAVSESKLKKNFKQVFGLPVYVYFQKARMQAARDKLLTRRFSIKEVAMGLGYSNLSNFSIAFRKEFGILPSQLLAS